MFNCHIFKMSLLPKGVYRVNTIPTKISTIFFCRNKKIILKFIWNLKGTLYCPKSPEKETKFGVLTLPDLKTYYNTNLQKSKQCGAGMKTYA